MPKKKILITGCAGAIGSEFVKSLDGNIYDIYGLDNMSSGDNRNLIVNGNSIKMKFIGWDVKSIGRSPFQHEKFDCVVHCAAQTDVLNSIKNVKNDADNNIIGTIALLEFMVKTKSEKLIFLSSGGALHSNPQVIPTMENEPPTPISPYGLSKKIGEKYIRYFTNNYDINAVCLRLSNVYGGNNKKGVIYTWVQQIKQKQTCFIDDKYFTRDYIHISDVVSAIKLFVNVDDFPRFSIYNVSTGIETELLGLAEILIGREKLFDDYDNGNKIFDFVEIPNTQIIKRSCLNNRKLKAIGWVNNIDLETGVKEFFL